MFNLVQFLEKRGLSSGVQPIKEKITADKIQGIKPVEQLGKVPEVKSIDEPVKSLTSSITDKPLKKVAYARNTGVRDASNNVYINREDVSLLAKLGYSVNRDEYLFLPLGESKEDLYSYIEKMAGVSRSVSRSVDRGEAFSGEYLKDMGYEVPEGYEVKGDLVCPVEKKAALGAGNIIKHISKKERMTLIRAYRKLLEKQNPGNKGAIRAAMGAVKDSKLPKVINIDEAPHILHYRGVAETSPDKALAKLKKAKDYIPGQALEASDYSKHIKDFGQKEPQNKKGLLMSTSTNPNVAKAHATMSGIRDSGYLGTYATPMKELPKMQKTKQTGAMLSAGKHKTEQEITLANGDNLLRALPIKKGPILKPGPGYRLRDETGTVIYPKKSKFNLVNKFINLFTKKADINNTPNNQATVADPYSGIAGDAAVNAGEAAAIYGANKLSKNSFGRIFTKTDKFPGVGPLLQNANLWKNVAKYIPVGGAAAQAYGAVDRFKNKDYIGSAIDGVGAVGSAAQILPNPIAKGVGLGVSTASTAVNAARDIHKYNNRPVEFRTTPPQLPTQPATAPNNTPISQPSQLAKQGEATHKLKSSNIRAVGYDKENKRLEVAFHSGGNYTYNDVPKSLFERIKRVKSPGKFFHKHIKRDNPYGYERIEKESEYKLHWSKDLHRDVTNNRHYPFSFLTGEAKELVDAVKNRDWPNFKEEIGDSTYAAQMLAAQATGLNHPVYADLSKHYGREKVWKDMFKEKGSIYHPKHMEGGSNYAKASKIIKAFASAGIKVDQREAERLANKYTGGKMEKEASKQPLLPAIKQWLKKQPFNHAEDAFKHGRIPKHVRDDVVSGRAANRYRLKFKEMLDHLRNSGA